MKLSKVITFTLLSSVFATQACAADSVQHSGKALKHSALASTHGVVTSAKVTSVAVAVPLIAVGSVGVGSLALADSVDKKVDKLAPIEITDKTITADPAPNQVMVKTTTKTETTTVVEK